MQRQESSEERKNRLNTNAKRWRDKNKERVAVNARLYRANNPDYSKTRYKNRKEIYAMQHKTYNQNARLKVLQYYCGSENPFCMCDGCNEHMLEFLSIDHMEGGGNEHRKKIGTGIGMYRWFIKNNFPSGYQVLCHNCNLAKGFYGICPHTPGIDLIDIALTLEA